MTIRELDPERDADAVVAIVREALPTAVISVDAWRHREATIPERARHRAFVAEANGRVVGHAQARFENLFTDTTDLAYLGVTVPANYRRRGIGAALYETALAHTASIGATRLLTSIYENDEGLRFAHARGFVEERSAQESVLDPRDVRESPPASVDLRRVVDVDPRLVHALDEAATRDQSAIETIDAIPYDEWVAHVLEHPLFTAEGSVIAMVGDIAASLSFLMVDHETGRGLNMFTGTLREYRGRGLALAAKLGSIQWAATNDVTSLVTANDATNAPMLAINRRLGYRPSGRYFDYIRNQVS